jgi:nucleoside-diphosphate-sugar epimerase
VLAQASKKRKPVFLASTSEVYGKSTSFPVREDGDLVLGPSTTGRWSYACSKASASSSRRHSSATRSAGGPTVFRDGAYRRGLQHRLARGDLDPGAGATRAGLTRSESHIVLSGGSAPIAW